MYSPRVTLIDISLPSLRMASWTVSPGLYSPMRVVREPEVPILTPLTAVMMSLFLSPALSAGESLMMADEL